MKRLTGCLFLLGCGTAFAQALQLPNETDLRAAYCIPVLQHMISTTDAINASELGEFKDKMLRDRRNDLHRVQSYLVPRITRLDPDGLMLAGNRGKIDAKEADATDLDRCSKECDAKVPNSPPYEAMANCLSACYKAIPVLKRMSVCYDITWLPF